MTDDERMDVIVDLERELLEGAWAVIDVLREHNMSDMMIADFLSKRSEDSVAQRKYLLTLMELNVR